MNTHIHNSRTLTLIMRLSSALIPALCIVMLLTGAPACAQKTISKKQWKKTTRIVYSCTNGSVIDPYKESFTVTADKDSASICVYLGHEYAGTVSMELSPEIFGRLKKQLAEQKLGTISEDKIGILPMGGDIERISCYAESEEDAFYQTYITGGVGTMAIKGEPIYAFSELLPIDIIIQEFKQQKHKEEQKRQDLQRPEMRLAISASQWEATTMAVYKFTDSSTPPDVHRSYTICACKDSITIDVYSYGDHLLHKFYPFSQEQFCEMKHKLAAQGITKGKAKDGILPTGGKTHALSFYTDSDADPIFSASSYAGIGTLYIEKGTAGETFIKALPENLDAILERTRTIHSTILTE